MEFGVTNNHPTPVGEATDARHVSIFERLVEWQNVGNLYEFAETDSILRGGTAREAGSLPYNGWEQNRPLNKLSGLHPICSIIIPFPLDGNI